jgi:uncharacterized membrane protein
MALRGLTLALIVLFLCRPIAVVPPSGGRDMIVPVLVDTSRSMSVVDVDGQPRLARAMALLRDDVLPALSPAYIPEVYSIGESLESAPLARFVANGRRSDLQGALAAVRERYRGRPVPGIVLISDGGDTGHQAPEGSDGPPVFAIGVGSSDGFPDREVLGITAGDPRLDLASVDLRVSAVSRGFGLKPFQLRVLGNGRLLDTRRVTPSTEGSPIEEDFTVAPDPATATVYTAQLVPEEDERVTENNVRSVLVSPAGRKRRALAIQGAPGFEHSFVTRALARDPGLEVDVVVRKGKNAEGADTFFVQAAAGRADALITGFPARRDALYPYDALIIANVEGDFFTREQLAMAAEFVGHRGGGLLVFGGRSFAQRGFIGTPIEEVLPVELNDRRGGLARASYGETPRTHNTIAVTPDGENHPVMRIAPSIEEARRQWAALPPLAGTAPLGGPRPGATVLAVTAAPGGAVHPLVAVQRYGAGRSMIFAGEAAWRWRMMLKSTDRTYEYFWRQAVRWLAGPAPDPIAIHAPDGAEPGESIQITVDARDAAFEPVPDADVQATIAAPAGEPQPLPLRREAGSSGRFAAAYRPDQPGLYRVRAEARRGATPLGVVERWLLVGGADREFTDPRLNEPLLRRIARSSGGRFVRTDEVSSLASWLKAAAPVLAAPERNELWHRPWAFALVVALLAAEWMLRRRWGLR